MAKKAISKTPSMVSPIQNAKRIQVSNIDLEGTIFQGDGRRFSFRLYAYGVLRYIDYYYQIRTPAWSNYKTFFSLRYGEGGENRHRVYLRQGRSFPDSVGAREEKILQTMKPHHFFRDWEKSAPYSLVNPVQLLAVPFLEDEIKNWILTEGQVNYGEGEIISLATSLFRRPRS